MNNATNSAVLDELLAEQAAAVKRIYEPETELRIERIHLAAVGCGLAAIGYHNDTPSQVITEEPK